MAKKQRFRLRFVFWLDMLDNVEQQLADYVEELKAQRTFAKTIRDGLRLIRDLRAGKVDVLFELFPWVKAEFAAGAMPKNEPDPSGSDKVQRELEQIKDLLLRSTPSPLAAPAGSPHALQPMTAPNLPSIFAEGGERTHPSEARKTFAGGMGNLFADDDDDDILVFAKDISAGNLQTLNTLQCDLPRFADNDIDTLVVGKATCTDGALNISNSTLALQL